MAGTPHSGEFPAPSAAAAVASSAPRTPVPRSRLRWFTRIALTVPGQIPTRFDPRSVDFDELRQATAAGLAAGVASAAARAPFTLSRQILDQRTRLDPKAIKPEPPDRDPAAEIRAYRFAWHFC